MQLIFWCFRSVTLLLFSKAGKTNNGFLNEIYNLENLG